MKSLIAALALTTGLTFGGAYTINKPLIQPIKTNIHKLEDNINRQHENNISKIEKIEGYVNNTARQELTETLQKEDDAAKEEAVDRRTRMFISFYGKRSVLAANKRSEIPKTGEYTFLYVLPSKGLEMISSWQYNNNNNDAPVLKGLLVPKKEIKGQVLDELMMEIALEGQAGTIDDKEKLFYNVNGNEVYDSLLEKMHIMQDRIADNALHLRDYGKPTEDGKVIVPLTEEMKRQVIEDTAYFESLIKEIDEKLIAPNYKEKK